MRNSRKSLLPSSAKDAGKKTSKRIDTTILENNPKIDHQLLEEYERLVTGLKDVIPIRQGADYNLSHPLATDMPTDAYHRGKKVSGKKQGADYSIAHPLATDRPTDAYHRGKRVTEDKNI